MNEVVWLSKCRWYRLDCCGLFCRALSCAV